MCGDRLCGNEEQLSTIDIPAQAGMKMFLPQVIDKLMKNSKKTFSL
jgi:hypothetical protein